MKIDSESLLENIKTVFIDQDKYYFDKHIPEFKHEGKFLGDCFSMVMVEPKSSNPPRFYHTFSPFDVISSKAPDRALVFEDGELLLDTDFAEYVTLRTGAMDTLLLQTIGVTSLADKNILYIGSGKITQASLQVLKSQFGELSQVNCISQTGDFTALNKAIKELGVGVIMGDLKTIASYDYIFCHTNSKEPLLTKDLLAQLKPGVVITSTISSTQHGEVTDEYFDPKIANIVCDWERTLEDAKDLNRTVVGGKVQKKEAILLKGLLDRSKTLDNTKMYTIYRSTGTPLQNLAVLQLLTKGQ